MATTDLCAAGHETTQPPLGRGSGVVGMTERKGTEEKVVGVERPGDQPWGKVYTAIIRDVTLPRNVKTIYTYLATWCADQRSAFPGRERMSEETDLSVSAIDEAKKIGLEVGLWSIEKVATKGGYSYNKYFLHDRDGGYVPGTGPGRRAKGKPRGRAAAEGQEPRPKSGRGHAQNLGPARPKSGPYQDKGSRPASIKTNASSGDAPARAHEQARGRAAKPPAAKRIHIQKPDAANEKELTRKLVAAGAAAMTKAGKPLGSRGRADIGRWAKENATTHQVDDLVAAIQRGLQAGLDGDPEFDWLFEDLPAPVSYPDTADGLDQLHDDYDGLPGAFATVESMWSDGYHPNAIVNTLGKQLGSMSPARGSAESVAVVTPLRDPSSPRAPHGDGLQRVTAAIFQRAHQLGAHIGPEREAQIDEEWARRVIGTYCTRRADIDNPVAWTLRCLRNEVDVNVFVPASQPPRFVREAV